jgi:hypothetical protein
MPELLDIAVEAHGGLGRWNEVSSIEIAVSIGGAIWSLKSQPDTLANIVMVADTDRQRVTTSFVGQNRQTTFEPNRIVIGGQNGEPGDVYDDPEVPVSTTPTSTARSTVSCFRPNVVCTRTSGTTSSSQSRCWFQSTSHRSHSPE